MLSHANKGQKTMYFITSQQHAETQKSDENMEARISYDTGVKCYIVNDIKFMWVVDNHSVLKSKTTSSTRSNHPLVHHNVNEAASNKKCYKPSMLNS